MGRISEDRYILEEGVYWRYTTDEKERNSIKENSWELWGRFLRIAWHLKKEHTGVCD